MIQKSQLNEGDLTVEVGDIIVFGYKIDMLGLYTGDFRIKEGVKFYKIKRHTSKKQTVNGKPLILTVNQYIIKQIIKKPPSLTWAEHNAWVDAIFLLH